MAAHAWPTNADLIVDVHRLGYIRDDDYVLDPTYGRGVWWRKWRPGSLIATDLYTMPDEWAVDFRYMPWTGGMFDVVAFDPPYKLNGTPSGPDEAYGVDVASSWQGRHALIRDGMSECRRVLRAGGYLLLKCQDQVCSGKVRWQTHEFVKYGQDVLGLDLVDELHLLAYRPQPDGRRQVHARRNFSTLLVFKAPK
jgi:hypothetical protein